MDEIPESVPLPSGKRLNNKLESSTMLSMGKSTINCHVQELF
jgi:hypothetical protein